MPILYLFVGYPGAGKTTVAQKIQELTGAEHIWADKERRSMFGKAYDTTQSTQLYDHLNQVAETLLDQGKSVIYDTNFNFRRDRDYLKDLAAKHGGETKLIWLATPTALSKKRAVGSRPYIDMTAEEFDMTAAKCEAPSSDEQPIKVDGTNISTETISKQICGL
jgi:predicted kinase